MKRIWILALSAALLCGCGEVKYYHQTPSETPSAVSEESVDTVPAFVFGNAGLYDSQNDAEFLLCPGVTTEQKDIELWSDGTHAVYSIQQEASIYLLCDEQGRVYKNASKPWRTPLEDEGWGKAYPTLRYEAVGD